jgi:hypothetical protein
VIEGYEPTISACLIFYLFLGDRTNEKVIEPRLKSAVVEKVIKLIGTNEKVIN